jgi:hypothetical protein
MGKYIKGFAKYISQALIFTILNTALSILMGALITFAAPKLGLRLEPYSVGINPDAFHKLALIPMWKFALAGFEDVAFVLPSLILAKRDYPILTGMVLAICSICFVVGHLYQGLGAALCKLHYVPLAFLYARRFGISRTITGHSIQDVLIMASIRLGIG